MSKIPPTKGFFESEDDYRKRISLEADERVIEETTGDAPSKGFFESQGDYRKRLPGEADEGIIEKSTGDAPSRGFFESREDYGGRISREADERVIEDVSGSAPSKGFFESQNDYLDRVSKEADESIIERATGAAPSKGFFESEDDYVERVEKEADEHRASKDSGSGGCFITTACVAAAGLPDDCMELTVLRGFRDGYVVRRPDGAAIIGEYYAAAPGIVRAIDASPRRREVLLSVLRQVREVVRSVQAGHQERAVEQYTRMFTGLRRDFGQNP